MTLAAVKAAIVYYDATGSTPNWNVGTLSSQFAVADSVDAGFISDFEGYIETLYTGSPSMAALLDYMVSSSMPIRIAKAVYEPGYANKGGLGVDSYLAFNFTEIGKVADFTTLGQWVEMRPELVIAHEFDHLIFNSLDPNFGDPTEAQQNTATFDHKGSAVFFQNYVAEELGFDDSIRTAYISSGDINNFIADHDYTEGKIIDISRVGDGADNNLDMSARTDYSRDLLFGMAGNDTLKGGDGDDHLYGGLGSDKLYGEGDGDILHGDEGNDFIDTGTNASILGFSFDFAYGGTGDDVIIMRGESAGADGEAGDDQYWIQNDAGENGFFGIFGSDPDDALFYNGYQLTGGPKTLIDIQTTDLGGGTFSYQFDSGALDSNGFRYYYYGTSLNIWAPDGGGVYIDDFSDGDLGITVGDQVDPLHDAGYSWSTVTNSWYLDTVLPASNIIEDGEFRNFEDLPGYAYAASHYGPNSLPTTWLV